MKTPKQLALFYWISTTFIFLFEGVMPALTSHTELAVEGIRHLGYPDYFRVLLTVYKVAGALVLILPFINHRIKEWAYAGFTFTIFSAFVSHAVVDGFHTQTYFPLIILAVLLTSYISYHKLRRLQAKARPQLQQDRYAVSSL